MDSKRAAGAAPTIATFRAIPFTAARDASGTPDAWARFRAAAAAAVRELDVMVQLNRMAQDAMNSGDLERMLAARDLLSEFLAGRGRGIAAAAGTST